MFGLLWTALIGLVIGVIAKFFMGGKDAGGCLVTILLGVAGSFVANWIGRTVGFYREGEAAGFIMSVAGAMLLLFLYRKITGGRTGT